MIRRLFGKKKKTPAKKRASKRKIVNKTTNKKKSSRKKSNVESRNLKGTTCPVCKKKFKKASNMKRHYTMAHKK